MNLRLTNGIGDDSMNNGPNHYNLGLLSIIVGYVFDTLMVDIIHNDKDIIQGNIIMYTTFDIVGLFMFLIT